MRYKVRETLTATRIPNNDLVLISISNEYGLSYTAWLSLEDFHKFVEAVFRIDGNQGTSVAIVSTREYDRPL